MDKSFNPAQKQFQDWLSKFQETGVNNTPQEYSNPPQSTADQINALPNSEKLTGVERWMYNALPGFAENSAVKALANFTEHEPVAKVLRFLDVGAEGLERTLGLFAQYRDLEPGDDFQIKDAWAAGSLFWDTARLPKFAVQDGRLTMRVESDLPGAYAVTEARKLLAEGKSMEEIRENYYSNLGALAIRAQMQDMWGHVIGDPLAWALGAVKPVQRLHAVRSLALTGKIDTNYAKVLEAGFLAEGKIDDAQRMADVIAKAEKSGKALTRADRFVISLTGGTPYLQKGKGGYELLDVAKASKLQKGLMKFNIFALNPQSRAGEMLDVIAANVGEYLIRPNWNKDPAEFVKSVQSMARGAIGETWGHLALTVQGRTVQGFAASADAHIKVLAKEWDILADERGFLARLAQFMPDMSERKIWAIAKRSPREALEKVIEASKKPGNEMLAQSIQRGEITEDFFKRIGMIDSKTPLMKDEFFIRAGAIIEDVAVKQAVVQFGVKERGALTKWADALKAWESIPFIRLNPANAMRNMVNNDVTLIGRGLMGTMTPGQIKNYWKGKYMPKMFERGFSLSGDELTDVDELFHPGSAIKVLEDALTGDAKLADKVKAAAKGVKLGPGEKISEMSAKMERASGLRASTNGWMEFHQQYWNKRTGFTSITKSLDTAVLDEMEQAMPGITRILDDVAQASGADSQKFSELLEEAVELNIGSVINGAEEALGFRLNDVLSAELMHTITDGLPAAIKSGTVDSFVSGVKAGVEKHIDDMFDRHVQELPGIVKAHVQAGGPAQFMRYFSKSADEFWAGNAEHAIRMSSINELIDYARSTKDYKKMRSLWGKVLADSESHFNRVWKKLNAYQDGLRQGAKEAGVKYPKEVDSAFKEMETGWKRFFEFRNKSYEEILGGEGKSTKSFEDLQKTLDSMYEALATKEDGLYQRVDDLMVESIPDELLAGSYKTFRDEVAELRKADRTHTQDFFKKIRGVKSDEAPALYQQYWQEKIARIEQIRQLEQLGSAALQGDSAALSRFASNIPKTENPANVWELAQNFGIATATNKGQRNTRRMLATVNKYLPEGTEKFKNVDDIPMDVAQKAFEARQTEKVTQAQSAAEKMFIPDVQKMLPDPFPVETALSELNYGRGYAALDAIVDEASAASQSKVLRRVQDLPEHLQKRVMQWKDQVDNEMSSFRSAGVQYAAFRRDSALLNYNRRTNFDTMLGNIAPFAFWSTHSAWNWLVHSLDRPAMLTNFLRTREFFETAGLPDQNVPARLKGNIRVNMPFAPEWMGDQFVNPLRFALPFDGWFSPWEQATSSKFQEESKVKRTLEEMLEKGVINEKAYQEAITDQSGDAWDMALGKVKEGGEGYDAMDFVQMTMTPHAPLMWAFNAARGEKSEIGPFTPMSRTIKNFATMAGVEDWSNSPYNVEGRIRKELGLPAYDKWDDYRTQRMISNLAADGTYSVEKIREAMEVAALVESGKMSPDDAKEQSEAYREAVKRQNIEAAGGWSGAVASMLGMPIRGYPTGEEKQRELAEQFSEAYQKYDNGDVEALTRFFDDHPEYESRLALFKSPEERLKGFMIDNMWARWNDLPKLTRDEMAEQMGDNFNMMFLDKHTRNYESITPDQLQIWLALTKGKQVGRLSAEKEALLELNQLKATDPATAWRVQTFYDTRKSDFEDYYELQNGYYNLPEGSSKRKEYLRENPQLKEYWDFRRSWMEKNPDLARYLTDDEKQLAKYAKMKRDPEVSVPNAQELRSNMSPEMQELLGDWTYGSNLPPSMDRYLAQLADQYGMTPRQLAGVLTGR